MTWLEKQILRERSISGLTTFWAGKHFLERKRNVMPWSPGLASSMLVMNRSYDFRQCLNLYILLKFHTWLTDIAILNIVNDLMDVPI